MRIISSKNLFLAAILAFVSAAAASAQTTVERDLRQTIGFLASDKLEGRRTGEPGASLAADHIAADFKSIGLRAGWRDQKGKASYLQAFPYTPTASPAGMSAVTGYNVIGILPGNDPTLRNEAIVIGGHYDHLGHGGEGSLAINSHEIHHGADDNASGTAAVIELARQFAAERSNKRTLIFIAFSGEEEGLWGSKFYVANPAITMERTIAMFNLDMVGRLYNDKLLVSGVGTASEWRVLVNAKNNVQAVIDASTFRQAPPKITTTLSQARPRFDLVLSDDGYGPSDHSSFYGKNVPVLFFTTGPHLDYHRPSDTADKINYAGEQQVISYVADLVRSVDHEVKRPTFLVSKSSPITTGKRAAIKVTLGTMPSYTDSSDGMVIDAVRDDSPAAKAGIRSGDKVVELAGQKISNVQDYTRVLGQIEADREYPVVVIRAGHRLDLKITPVKRQ